MKIAATLLLATLFTSGTASAQFGTLDSDFDGDGIVSTFQSGTTRVDDLVVQPDGKIVTVGSFLNVSDWEFLVMRFLPDGSVDNTFGTGGKVTLDFDGANPQDNRGRGIALQSDGKILVVGEAYIQTDLDVAVARLMPNGVLDNTFNTIGMRTIHIGQGDGNDRGVVIKQDANGKIIVGGNTNTATYSDFLVLRLNENGSNDISFNVNSRVIVDFDGSDDQFYDLTILPDGRIASVGSAVIGGSPDYGIVMLNTDGSFDNMFSSDGKLFTDLNGGFDIATYVNITADNKLLVTGVSEPTGGSNYDYSICKYNLNGTLDLTFTVDGKQTYGIATGATDDICLSSVVQPDGKIVLVGYGITNVNNEFLLLRINADGSTDNTFGTNGIVSTPVTVSSCYSTSATLQPDLRLLVGGFGSGNGQIVRYLTGLNVGLMEFSQQPNVLVYPNPVSEVVNFQFTLKEQEVISITLYDSKGAKVADFVQDGHFSSGEHELTFQLSALKAGNYYTHFTTSKGSTIIQFNVQ